jgi:hypothetical protein
MNEDIKESPKGIYPDKWKEVFLFSVFRLLYNTPIKNLQTYMKCTELRIKIDEKIMPTIVRILSKSRIHVIILILYSSHVFILI